MTIRINLFVYGQLKSMYSPPKTMSSFSRDFVRGWMYPHQKEDVILVAPGAPDAPWCEGELQVIASSELDRIDKVEYGAKYDRKVVRTRTGVLAFVYEWSGVVPKGAEPINVFYEHQGRAQ